MRLIDAGSLKENILNKQMYLIKTEEGVFCYYVAVLDAINMEPTVKAIPIEWIENEIKRLDEDIKWAWYYGNTALDKMEYLKMWLTIKLEDWKKEHEIN